MYFAQALLISASLTGAEPVPSDASTDTIVVIPSPSAPASYERVGEIVIGTMICPPFGYSVNNERLEQWTDDQVTKLADQTEGFDNDDATRLVNRAIIRHYWMIRSRYANSFEYAGTGQFYNRRRFHMRYSKVCAELARSPDGQAIFEKTGEEEKHSQLVTTIRRTFMRLAIDRPATPGKRRPIGDVRIPQ